MESAKSNRAEGNGLRAEEKEDRQRLTADLRRYLNGNLHTGELNPKLIPDKYQNLVNSWKGNPGPDAGDEIWPSKIETGRWGR